MSSDLTAQIHQYLTGAPSSLFAQQEVEIVAHWQGDANLLWRVKSKNEDAVVKQFLDAGQARSRRQYDGHQLFARVGLAPHPLWADRYPHGLSRQIIVYRWCDGESLAPEDSTSLWAWAEAVALLHSTPTDEVRRFSPHPLNLDFYWRIEQGGVAQITNWLAASDLYLTNAFQVLARAAEALAQDNLNLWQYALPTAVHGDLSRDHTLNDRGRIVFLDWEMFGLGDPALDVARFLQREATALTQEQTQAWLDSYLQFMRQTELAERIAVYSRLLAFHNVVYLLVGLHQQAGGRLDSDLQEALPFLQSTLTTALDNAANAFNLSEQLDSASLVSSFFQWFANSTQATH